MTGSIESPPYERNYPGYPEGWFAVARSHEIRPGQVKAVHYFGRELVVFRSESGRAQVLDAFCPHLGTHLGHGGAVDGENLVCPFHGWRFDAQGQCVKIPYCERIPQRARVGAWPTAEAEGMVLVHYSASRRAPETEPVRLPQFHGSEWLRPHTTDFIHHGHPQDVLENSVDCGHMPHVHGLEFPTDLVLEEHSERLNIRYSTRTRASFIGGLPGMPPIEPRIEVNVYGLGFATSESRIGRVLHYLVRLWVTPIGPDSVHQRYTFTARYPGWSRLWGHLILWRTAAETERELRSTDVILWDRKRFATPPVLCEADDVTARYRRWAARFYGDASQRPDAPRFDAAVQADSTASAPPR